MSRQAWVVRLVGDAVRRGTCWLVTVLLAILSTIVLAPPAQATFPGRNGLVAFIRAGNVFTASASGANIKQLTRVGGLSNPRWSPDGKKLAYKNSSGVVFVRTMATGRVVTVGVGALSGPVWSPDGTRVAWSTDNPDSEQYLIYPTIVMATDPAGTMAPAVIAKVHDEGYPYEGMYRLQGWSLDGQRLLFIESGGCCGGEYWYRTLQEFDLATQTFLRPMVSLECDAPVGPCRTGLGAASYGPGGKAVLFSGVSGGLPGSSNSDEQPEKLFMVDTDGANLHAVSSGSAGYEPVWAPAGGYVLFTQRSGTTLNVMRAKNAAAGAGTLFIRNASQADWQAVR